MVADDGANRTLAYALASSTPKEFPYVLVTYARSVAHAIQLTGPATPDQVAFSSIRLADSVSVVESVLGKPYEIAHRTNPEAELWSYDPYPISVEISQGRVASIRIWMPEKEEEQEHRFGK